MYDPDISQTAAYDVTSHSGETSTYRLYDKNDPEKKAPAPAGTFVIIDINDVDRCCIQDVDGVGGIIVETSMANPVAVKNLQNVKVGLKQDRDFDWAEERMLDGTALFSTPGAVKYCGKCSVEKWMKITSGGGHINMSFVTPNKV